MKKKLNGKPVNVTNILFLGIDKEENASDSIIILSVDEDNKKIKIKDYEIPEMENYGMTKPGVYNLSGKRVLGYSKIRHVGQNDYERT